ncbi:MAG: family 43 glycosylhydrolase [Acidimicrobiales bacterium]
MSNMAQFGGHSAVYRPIEYAVTVGGSGGRAAGSLIEACSARARARSRPHRRPVRRLATGASFAVALALAVTATMPAVAQANRAASPAGAVPSTSTLAAGGELGPGASLTAPGGRYRLVMQSDGNLVLYWLTEAAWQTRTSGHAGAHATMQRDGNLVVYEGNKPLWSSRSGGNAAAAFTLSVLQDGNVVIDHPGGRQLWSSHSETSRVRILPERSPAFNGDAGDPSVLPLGAGYVAFTTGTPLGNNIQALVDSGSPAGGYASYTHHTYGSTALATPPRWEQKNTATSPSVLHYGGHWLMFYDASTAPHPTGTGYDCISVATATTLNASSPKFTDKSARPLVCEDPIGVLDPTAFVDPRSGKAYLLWKSNDGASSQPSHVWSRLLDAAGTGFSGPAVSIWTNDTARFPWETTLDDPSLAYANGRYFLMFSVGNFQSAKYSEAFAVCRGPAGSCSQPSGGPFLSTYSHAYGPAGGSLFSDSKGNWWIVYAAWNSSRCQSYSCGAKRLMYVAPIDLGG